jgi:hypothetical protein
MKRATLLLLLLLCALGGCRPADPPAESQSKDRVQAALVRSPVVRQYVSSIKSKWRYLPDGTVNGGVIVAVGEDHDDHFTRGLTAKVMDDGRVFILTTQQDGDEVWKAD